MLILGASARQVRQAFATVNRRIRSHPDPGGTTLIFFYSGHADARGLHLGPSTLSYPELRRLVHGSQAQVKIVFIDGCRSGGLTRVKGVRAARAFKIKPSERLRVKGLAYITSSTAGEQSFESERLRGSFFAHHLTAALQSSVADRNRDGRVTLSEAYSYTYHQTLRSSGRGIQLQHPTFETNLRGRGEVVLTEPARYRRSSGVLKLSVPGHYLVMRNRSRGPIVSEVVASAAGTRLYLRPGRYVVQRRSRKLFLQYQATLRARQEVDLALLIPHPIQYARLVRKGGGRGSSHSLLVQGGVRGEIISGQGITPQVNLNYGLDLPWFTLGIRARFSTSGLTSAVGETFTRQYEAGVGLGLERVVDLPWFSLAVGIWGELTILNQVTLQNDVLGSPRWSYAASVGVTLALEREIAGALYLRLEGGPLTVITKRATVIAGQASDAKVVTPFTFWFAGGLGWRF